MTRFRGGARRFTSSNRRLTQWFRATDITGYTTVGPGIAILDQSLVGITEPITSVRCRGSISMVTDQEAATEQPFGAVGMCVVTDQAAAIGVTAVPTPITDKDSDAWIMHKYIYAPMVFGSAIGLHNLSQTFDFDSKAMRKVPEGSVLIWVVENSSPSFSFQYALQFAVLIKLA